MRKLQLFRVGLTVVLIAMLVMTIHPLPITAQEKKTVSYDTPVESQLTDANSEETWTLEAPAKDTITITVERTGGTLAPIVELRDSNSQRLAGASVDYTYAMTIVKNFALPSAGTYTVAVGRYSAKDGKTTGNYKLTVALTGAGEDNPSVKVQPKPIEYDNPAAGELTNARWREGWTFNATGKDVISVNAKRVDGTVLPELLLQDSSGNIVSRTGNFRDGTSATIDHFQLPNPGQYTVIVKRYSDQSGNSVGKYSVLVILESAGADRADLGQPVGPVTIDKSVSGSLTNTKWADVYTFDAQSKDNLRITATRTDGSLFPEIFLYGANNQEIQHARADETYAASTLDVALPGPGKYQIRVQRQDGESGYTAGKYELAVTVLGTGDDNPVFKTSAGEVKAGTPIKGTLTNAKWQDSYSLNVQGQDPLTIIVKRTSGTLVPILRLVDSNQQDVNTARFDDTYTTAIMNEITVPGAGQYTIVVSRDQNAAGQTSGGYELNVTQGKKQ
ncbi:MAG: PPC domain-containing protein [Chloroflexota bacterium]